MSCCPPAPTINIGGSSSDDYPAQDTEIQPGESVECYGQRAGNSTGKMDDKTEPVPNKIENTDIPLTGDARVSVTFRLTPNSTRTATSWEMKDADGNILTNFSGTPSVTFSNGVLSGQFDPTYYGKSIKIKITAKDGAGEIDTRAYTFSPAKATGLNEIQFVHPLPGAKRTSPYGPRIPPAIGASSMHHGVDFALRPAANVLAAADGEVMFADVIRGGGNCIRIKHLNGAGQHLCTTSYMHLDRFYVKAGQKVTAGQKIALEGSTGVSTGTHLHFECRLPNNMAIDPEPLIRGTFVAAREVNSDNTAKEGTLETREQNNVLTRENATAKENGCSFGSDYPKDPAIPNAPLPPSDDPFERAWFFTQTHEVGPWWNASFPNDPEVQQGLIETKEQRHKVGYIVFQGNLGGETKFGIAKGPNPSVDVKGIGYTGAKQIGYNQYWKAGAEQLSALKPRAAVMYFDLTYLHGPGSARSIKRRVTGFNTLTDDAACVALSAAQKDFIKNDISADRRALCEREWLKRNADLLAYVQAL